MSEREQLAEWFEGRTFADWRAEFDDVGYIVFDEVLNSAELQGIKDALQPYFEQGPTGRNNFEGLDSHRVYALLAKSPVFADLVEHPLPLAFAEAELGESCRLSACLAINLHPGETVQPWHWDDAHLQVPLPRPSWGVSAFWAIDDTTEENGATQVVPRSHREDFHPGEGVLAMTDSLQNIADGVGSTGPIDEVDPQARPDAVAVPMRAGSLMLAKGTLLHRGGANNSDSGRLIVTPQYCPGWARQLENMVLAVPAEIASGYSTRVQELIGYGIHKPFMGYVDGMHPARTLLSDRLGEPSNRRS